MPFQHVLERLKFSPWFCTPGAYQTMVEVVDAVMARVKGGAERIEPSMEGISLRDMQSRRPMQVDQHGIAHIHVLGAMGRNLSPIENTCGRTDYATLEREMVQAKERARAACFEFDTPGGSALGCDQTAKKIAALDLPKVGFTETQCTSGGMYLAAGLDRIFAASGSIIGSIGVVMPWVDTSKLQELMQVSTRLFVNQGASLKGMRAEVPLTEEQADHLQEVVDDLGTAFRSHLEDFRTIDKEVFKAGSYMAQRGVDLGLADEVGGRDEAMNYLLTKLRV